MLAIPAPRFELDIMDRIVIYTNTVSPHQLPLAKELVAQVGEGDFRYIYTEVADRDHGGLGWNLDVPDWCVHAGAVDVDEWLENADVLLSGLRCFDLFERRAKKGLKNFYMTERWFKPPIGIARLLHPLYFGYARRFCSLMELGAVVGLPIGIPAARDMARLCGLMHGDLRCLFGAPEVEFEGMPGGRIFNRVERVETCRGRDGKYCLEKMRMWGYFVKSSEFGVKSSELEGGSVNQPLHSSTLKVLWVGRLLGLKRVDTIIRAVGELAVSSQRLAVSDASTRFYTFYTVNHLHVSTRSTRLNIPLDIYGSGPEEARLKEMAAQYGDVIKFHPPVPIDEVRKLMREHDVYVLASNGYEGWGAVVSEALEEGMLTLGTYEAGSSATMLPESHLFRAGDWRALAELLRKAANGELKPTGIGEWSAEKAAEWLLASS